MVRDTILCPWYNTNDSCTLSETRKRDLDTALLSGKTKGGKIDGLYIALDADGVEVPETDKGNLEQHILSIVKHHGSEKGVGKSAYAATAAFHECMFSTTNDWRGKPLVACQSGLMVTSAVQRYTGRLTLLTPLLLHTQEKEDNPAGTWNSTFLHNCMTLRPIASDDLHFHEPPEVTHAFSVLQHPSTSLCVTMGTFRQALGKDHDPNRKLIALQVLNKHLETSGTGPPGSTQTIRLPNKSWTLLHDTVVEVMESRKSQIRTESNLIQQMLNTHAVNTVASFGTAPLPCQLRDESFRRIFQPFTDLTELRHHANACKKGKTGRLTTVDEICEMSDEQLIPILAITNLIFAGEVPEIIKLGDIVPLRKDLKRARPVTCLDAIFKIVDRAIGTRLMLVCQEYGLLPANSFSFIPGGSCEWPIECVASVQRRARQEDNAAFLFLLDATSAYDTVSHRGISMACKSFAVPTDVESRLLAHVRGHSRVVNTAYGLGEEVTKITLEGGLAQGANSSPALFIFTTAPAHRYAAENLPDYFMPSGHSQPSVSTFQPY